MAALPAPAKRLLLTAALESSSELRVLPGDDYRLDDLGPAQRDQLMRITTDRHRVVFRHPLIRSAVVAESTSADRRRVHHALATALVDDERRAWHRAEAPVEPDEEVAAQLEAAARRVLARGDHQAVTSLLCRAADLSPWRTGAPSAWPRPGGFSAAGEAQSPGNRGEGELV